MPLKLLERDDSHEFKPVLAEIESDPGSPLGRIVFWLVIGVVAFFILWSVFGEVDVVVTARGKTVPAGEIKEIQPLNGGVVSAILVKEGDFVKKGQKLVVVDPSMTEPGLLSSQKTLEQVRLEQARLAAQAKRSRFEADNAIQKSLHQASLMALKEQLNAKANILDNLTAQAQARQAELQLTRDVLETNQEKEKRLRSVRDIIAKDEYERVQNDILAGESRLKELTHELEQLAYQQQQTRAEMSYLEQDYNKTSLNELSEREKQANELEATIEEGRFRNARQTLTAPVDGYVHELFVHTVGGVVTPAQKVLSIVPANTPLLVQATVLNKDIGYVRRKMPVALKVDTYDFQKYGTLDGVVSQIDRDSREDEKLGPVYTVYVEPKQASLNIEGKPQSLSSGLTLTAEIKVGKRRIIEFLLYPLIEHLDEGLSVR